MGDHSDLDEEQRFLDRAYAGLEAMREDASRMLSGVLDLGRGGTFQSRTERDIVVRTSLARLAQLDIGDQALCFGRIDRLPEPGQERGDSFHIGRLAVSGSDLEPLVVDWRAPVAEPFYRATGLDPQGLARRRHLAVRARTVTGVEDEYFAPPEGMLPDGSMPGRGNGNGVQHQGGGIPGNDGTLVDGSALGGPGALLVALGQSRTGQMGDIVATIQREQDEIIRAPLAGLLVVQGGPGTGKTAVALHRAAYLLYTHRFPLEGQGVLVVGPNPLFLRYIEQVLPSLGETGVTLATMPGLVPEVRVRGADRAEVARLKGEARMAKVMARAVRTRQRALRREVTVPFGAAALRLTVADSAEAVALGRRRPGPHNARRRLVEQELVRRLVAQYLGVRRSLAGPGLEDAEELEGELDLAEVGRQLRRVPELAEALDRMWPRLSPHELVHDLFGARPLLAAAGKGILSTAEQAALYRPRSHSLEDVPWTAADTALVDEARTLLGPRRSRSSGRRPDGRARAERPAPEGGFWPAGLDASPLPAGNGARNGSAGVRNGGEDDPAPTYGHIVIDEAQDLSPMQLRMLARRSLSGSMTMVGDIAQATGPWAPDRWEEVIVHLAPRRPPRRVELTVGYRTPVEVVEMASRVLAVAAPELAPPRAVRRSGHPPLVERAAPAELAGTVAEAVAREMAQMDGGRSAVLAPTTLLGPLGRALDARGVPWADPRDPKGPGLASPLVLLPADEANGLEFDLVVVVEPAGIAGEDGGRSTRGLRALYVAMTRPTRQLVVVHSLPLPVDLGPLAPATRVLAQDRPGRLGNTP